MNDKNPFKSPQGFKERKPSQEVTDFHNRDDVDASRQAHHHTLGYKTGQAAPGIDIKTLQAADVTLQNNINFANFVRQVADDALDARLDALEALSFVHRQRAAVQTILNATATDLSFPTLTLSQGVSPVTYAAPTFTINQAGIYDIDIYVQWANNVTGRRMLQLVFTGSMAGTWTDNPGAPPNGPGTNNLSLSFHLNAGDTIKAVVTQNSGGNLDVSSADFMIKMVNPD